MLRLVKQRLLGTHLHLAFSIEASPGSRVKASRRGLGGGFPAGGRVPRCI